MAVIALCCIDDCGKPVLNMMRQLCSVHYEKWKRYKDPRAGKSLSEKGGRLPMPEKYEPWGQEPYWRFARLRFFRKIEVKESGCWEWKGGFFHEKPYGQFSAFGKTLSAHRFSYEALRGPVPDKLTLDHLCRNPACMNPSHLEPVPAVENVMRGTGPHATNARKFECKRGHAFVESNIHYTTSGSRMCMECHRQKARRLRKNRTPEQIERDRIRQAKYEQTRDKKARAAAKKAAWYALPEEERARRRAKMNAYDAKRRAE